MLKPEVNFKYDDESGIYGEPRTVLQLKELILMNLPKDGSTLEVLTRLLTVADNETIVFNSAIDLLKGEQKVEVWGEIIKPKSANPQNKKHRDSGYSVKRRFDRRSPDKRRFNNAS